MAKTRTKKVQAQPVGQTDPACAIDPKTVHELFGMPGPYDETPEPPRWPDSVNVWDCGMSITEMHRRFRSAFYPADWFLGHGFAKQTDSWKWRQFSTKPVLPGEPYLAQLGKVKKGDEVPFARDVVSWLLLHFLATGERLVFPRLRCRDVLPSGRRAIVSFGPLGFDLGSVSDTWESPGIALATVFAPKPPTKK